MCPVAALVTSSTTASKRLACWRFCCVWTYQWRNGSGGGVQQWQDGLEGGTRALWQNLHFQIQSHDTAFPQISRALQHRQGPGRPCTFQNRLIQPSITPAERWATLLIPLSFHRTVVLSAVCLSQTHFSFMFYSSFICVVLVSKPPPVVPFRLEQHKRRQHEGLCGYYRSGTEELSWDLKWGNMFSQRFIKLLCSLSAWFTSCYLNLATKRSPNEMSSVTLTLYVQFPPQ